MRVRTSPRKVLLACVVGPMAVAGAATEVHLGPELDYQAAMAVLADGSQRVVVERLNPQTAFGDLYLAQRASASDPWSEPVALVASAANERHPSLLRLSDDTLLLAFLRDTGAGGYRIFIARADALGNFAEPVQADLGWASGGEVNPQLILDLQGRPVLSYHRLNGAAYLARSGDGGVTWDTLRTQTSPGNAALPRLAQRGEDGRFLLVYQVNPGDNQLDLYVRSTLDPYVWTDVPQPLNVGGNSHDAFPLALVNGEWLVMFTQIVDGAFDLHYRLGLDTDSWSDALPLTTTAGVYEVQPYGLLHPDRSRVQALWSMQKSPNPYVDHDIMQETLTLGTWLFVDDFEDQAR